MASKKSSFVMALIMVGQSAAFAIPDLNHLFRRAPFNVERYASLGESFASGPSAGNTYDEVTKCRRYTEAQGPQVAVDGRIQGPKKFDFIACSGSKLKNIYQDSPNAGDKPEDKPKISQAGALKDKNPDLVTMSIGGNDVGFVDLLDRCVYRFYDLSGCRGCGPFPRWDTNDCTDDCNEAVKVVQDKIDSPEFAAGLSSAIKAVFQSAPRSKLFITGYPRFWNAETDACDSVSFKFGCINNSILPLVKDRRAKMNKLTDNLNAKIKSTIDNYPTGASLTFVDPNPFYDGHRFCEEGVSEPSYRNDKIYFYPFEYWTGGTLNLDGKAAGDCQSILDNSGDQGDYFACEMANEIKAGNTIDLSKQPNNVNGEVAISSSDNLPDYLARIFHPTKKGMTGYRDAIVSAYSAYDAATPTASAGPSATPTPGGDSGGQQLAWASYTNPLGDPAAWARLISYDSGKLSILVANVLNGPNHEVDESWASVIQQATASGKTVVGYVRTGYLGVSQQKFKTRLGSGDLADWASQIEQDVDKWFELYPSINGIFFDEGWPECGTAENKNIYADLYRHINAYTKQKHSGAFTVLNPGSSLGQCFEDTMDTLLTFESSYTAYTTSAYNGNTWKPRDPRKIWHIVYEVPQDKIASVAALARERFVGYLEVTDDNHDPNPYDNVPSESYMQAALGAVSGGKVLKADAPKSSGSEVSGSPGDAKVIASDYTSATITWSPVANALGYAVYQNGKLVLELPSSLTRATVGMLQPGTSASFEVKAVLSSGGGGGEARSVTASTKSLPAEGSITKVGYQKNGATVVYTADVLVPYAFVRLFIGGPHKAVGASSGWPIQGPANNVTGGDEPMPQFKLTNYMVEGNDFYSGFYKYSGAYIEGGSAKADWTWTPQGTAPQSQSGYTYTWNVPLGGTDALPEDYVVQGQGYAPLQNVFGGSMRSYKCNGQPCDDNPDYDCKGSSMCTTPDLLKWCDHAANNLTRTDTYGATGGIQTGNCWGDGVRGCGVFLQGSECSMTGEDMWTNYQNIRNLGGCKKCGSWHQTNGCLLTVNYVSNCDIGLEPPQNPDNH